MPTFGLLWTLACAVGWWTSRIATVEAGKSFPGTRHQDLVPLPLPDRLLVQNVDDLVRLTEQFHNHYSASTMTEEEFAAAGGAVQYETKPDVLFIAGAPVPSSGSGSDGSGTNVKTYASPLGLVGTATSAYGFHHNLQLRPDDVWITILAQFSFYVQARAELLRDRLVSHEGQKELKVTVGPEYDVYTAPYDDMTRQFLDKITQNLKDSTLQDWFRPGFSTTTHTDEVVAAASAMCTFQDYFTYTYEISCGIPSVTLLGTVDDWRLLFSKIDRLPDYDDGTGLLVEWVDLLRGVLSNLVESAENGSENNLDFWDNICYYNSNGYGTDVLSGWMTVFSFFDKDGQRTATDEFAIETSSQSIEPPRSTFPSIKQSLVNPNVLSCPATVDDKGTKYNATLFVGQMSFELVTSVNEVASGQMEVRPRNDWALVIEEGTVELERPSPHEDSPFVETITRELLGAGDVCYWF